MKKALSLMLAAIFLITVTGAVFAASDLNLTYHITSDGDYQLTVPSGTIIPVSFAVENNGGDEFTLSSLQNEIYFDHSFFEYVEGSASVEQSGIRCDMKVYSDNEHRVFVNTITDTDFMAKQTVASFKLKVIETKTGAQSLIETKSQKASDVKGGISDIAEKNLTVIIGESDPNAKKYDITYYDDNDTVLYKDEAVVKGSTTNLRPAPEKDGYKFLGWKVGDQLLAAGSEITVTGAVSATARWEAKVACILSFNSNGGTFVETVTGYEGDSITLDQKTTRTGYIFSGWYSDSGLTNEITSVILNGNTTVYAKWTKKSVGGGGNGGSAGNLADDTREYTKDIFGNEHPTHIGYINGYPDGSVQPEGNITREEIAAILYRITNHEYEKPFAATGEVFLDVQLDRWSVHDIEYMADKNVIYGYPDGEFKPSRNLSRAEFAALIFRFTGLEKADTENPFTDLETTHWAYSEILALANSGLVEGYEDNTFKPQNNITRAEVMTVINKLLGRKPVESYVKSLEFNPYTDLHEDKWYYVTVLEATITHNYWLDKTGYEYKWEDWK